MNFEKGYNRCLCRRGVTVVVCFFLAALILLGCEKKEDSSNKPKEREKDPMARITVKYPSYQIQMEKLKEFNDDIQDIQKLESRDRLLREMLQQAQFNSVEKHLDIVSKSDNRDLGENAEKLKKYLQEINDMHPYKYADFLEKAYQDKNVDLLVISLSALTDCSEAALKLGEIGDPETVRPLLLGLVSVAGPSYWGSQGETTRKKSRRNFVEAISRCTGLQFPGYDAFIEEETIVAIQRVEKWLQNPKKLENKFVINMNNNPFAKHALIDAKAAYNKVTGLLISDNLEGIDRLFALHGRPIPPEKVKRNRDRMLEALQIQKQMLQALNQASPNVFNEIKCQVAINESSDSYDITLMEAEFDAFPLDLSSTEKIDKSRITYAFVTFVIPDSADIARSYIPNSPDYTKTKNGDLKVIMVYKNGKWLWTPFGWI